MGPRRAYWLPQIRLLPSMHLGCSCSQVDVPKLPCDLWQQRSGPGPQFTKGSRLSPPDPATGRLAPYFAPGLPGPGSLPTN